MSAIRHSAVAATSFTATGLALALARRTAAPDRGATGQLALSPRENEALRLLGAGRSIPEIADTMLVSQSTAKTYVARVYEKLGASNRAQALMTALRRGLIRHDLELSA